MSEGQNTGNFVTPFQGRYEVCAAEFGTVEIKRGDGSQALCNENVVTETIKSEIVCELGVLLASQ